MSTKSTAQRSSIIPIGGAISVASGRLGRQRTAASFEREAPRPPAASDAPLPTISPPAETVPPPVEDLPI